VVRGASFPPPAASLPTLLRRAWRIIRWGLFAVAVLVIFLVLRPSEPPEVSRDPQAPQRLQRKLDRFAAVAQGGNPATLRLDESDLNAWMSRTLDLPAEAHARVTENAAGAPGADSSGRMGAERPSRAPGDAATPQSDSGWDASLDARTDMSVEEARSAVQDVRVKFIGDQLYAWVLFDLYGKDLSLSLQGTLQAEGGYMRLRPSAMWIGSLPIPQKSVEGACERLFGSPEHRETFRLPPGVRDFRVEESALVVTTE